MSEPHADLLNAARAYAEASGEVAAANALYVASGKGAASSEYDRVRKAGTGQAHAGHALEVAATTWANADKRANASLTCPACGGDVICERCRLEP